MTQDPDFSVEEEPNFRLLNEDEDFYFGDQNQGS